MNRSPTARGFSLLETLLAVTLTLALAASVYAFLFELLGRRARLVDAASTTGAVSGVFDRIGRDLAFAVVSGPDGAGIAGGADRLRLTARAVLPFTIDADAHPGDLRVTEITLDRERRRLLGSTWPALTGRPPAEPDVLAEGVRDLRFRFHDGRAWSDSFDSSSTGRLPTLVEVSIWMGTRAEEPPEDDLLSGPESPEDAPLEDLFEAGPRSAAFTDEMLLDTRDLGPPTRRRVFAVPDADPATAADAERAEGGPP